MLVYVNDSLYINANYVTKVRVAPHPTGPVMDNRGEPIQATYDWKVVLVMEDGTELQYGTYSDEREASTQLHAAVEWLNNAATNRIVSNDDGT